MQIKGIPQWRHGSCELEVWEAVDVPVSRRSSRQMRTIRMPRGHLIDKCDLVRVSHMMLLSRTARRNLRKRGAEQTQYPWHFARPTSWQLTGDANYQDLLLADIELPNSSKIESWYNSPLQSIMLILRLDSIPFWFAYRSQAISGSLITIKGVTNIRFLVRRHSRLQSFARPPPRIAKGDEKLSDTLIDSHLGQRHYQSRKNDHI